MEKMGYEKGLVRYTTENTLEGEQTRVLRPRLIGYATALTIMIIAFTTVLIARVPIELDIIRDRGALHQINADGLIQNNYLLKIANMTEEPQTFLVSVSGLDGLAFDSPQELTVAGSDSVTLPTILVLPKEANKLPTNKIMFTITSESNENLTTTEESRFFGPANF
jgi:polyferredoxin